MAEKKGVKVHNIFWCVGRYDLVAITEGKDEAVAAALLTSGSLGSIRTETLRAMDLETFSRVLQNVG